jgi:hypothetical protein
MEGVVMNRHALIAAIQILMVGVLAPGLCASTGSEGVGKARMITPKIAPEESMDRARARAPESMPFYVYNNAMLQPVRNFAASGYMGDIADLKLSGFYKDCHQEGYPCLKVMYQAEGPYGWAGLAWQNPANNWGQFDGGYDLTNAKKLSFWARGDKGGEVVEFKFGGTAVSYPDSETVTTGPITLTDEWTEFIVDVSSADLHYISSGFGLVVKQDENPGGCIFYLDEVKFDQ